MNVGIIKSQSLLHLKKLFGTSFVRLPHDDNPILAWVNARTNFLSQRILILKKNLTEEQAFKHEIYMIAVLGRKDLGTGILRNLTDGGEGGSGWKPTEEQKQKSIRARTGRKASPAHCRAISEGQKGKVNSPEARAKMKIARNKRVISEEQKRKTSMTMKGRPHSPEHRRKLAEANRARALRERSEKER